MARGFPRPWNEVTALEFTLTLPAEDKPSNGSVPPTDSPLCRTLVAARGWYRSGLEKLVQCALPTLWKPPPDQFFPLDALPHLGTGKLDLRKAREIATARSAEQG